VLLFSTPSAGGEGQAVAASSASASGAAKDLKIFSGDKRLFASYGPSTTVGYAKAVGTSEPLED